MLSHHENPVYDNFYHTRLHSSKYLKLHKKPMALTMREFDNIIFHTPQT